VRGTGKQASIVWSTEVRQRRRASRGAATSGDATTASPSRRFRARGRRQAVPATPSPCDRGTGWLLGDLEAAVARVNVGGAAKNGGGTVI
jgi:hypothetical protein